MSGLYSRRINRKHRVVYSIDEKVVTVYVFSAWTYYGDI
ncbi:MAG: type II toxin-antitoxin system YoeB family toxin [Bacteroidota bacterium]